MNKNIIFVKNLYGKLLDNYNALNILMYESPEDVDQILNMINQRDLIIKSITKLTLKLNIEDTAGKIETDQQVEFNEIKSFIAQMIINIEEQYKQLYQSLTTTKESLSNELKHVSINKNKIKGYNLNSVK